MRTHPMAFGLRPLGDAGIQTGPEHSRLSACLAKNAIGFEKALLAGIFGMSFYLGGRRSFSARKRS